MLPASLTCFRESLELRPLDNENTEVKIDLLSVTGDDLGHDGTSDTKTGKYCRQSKGQTPGCGVSKCKTRNERGEGIGR